jgi:hypothetical protein
MLRAVDEQIGDALERCGSLLLRAVLNDRFELWNERRGRGYPTFLAAKRALAASSSR